MRGKSSFSLVSVLLTHPSTPHGTATFTAAMAPPASSVFPKSASSRDFSKPRSAPARELLAEHLLPSVERRQTVLGFRLF